MRVKKKKKKQQHGNEWTGMKETWTSTGNWTGKSNKNTTQTKTQTQIRRDVINKVKNV